MSKLVEAEMDGAAAAKQVMALKDTIGKLKTVGGGTGPREGQAASWGGVFTQSSGPLCDIPGPGESTLGASAPTPTLTSGA